MWCRMALHHRLSPPDVLERGFCDCGLALLSRLLDGHEYMVEEVLDQWYGPEDVIFKVRADDGNVHILRHETSELDADWSLVSFRVPG